MMLQYAYPWNAPREAISSADLRYEEIYRRDRQVAALLHAWALLEKQPTIVQLYIKGHVSTLEKSRAQRANAYLAETFVERILPRVERVNKQYGAREISRATFCLLAGTNPAPGGS